MQDRRNRSKTIISVTIAICMALSLSSAKAQGLFAERSGFDVQLVATDDAD